MCICISTRHSHWQALGQLDSKEGATEVSGSRLPAVGHGHKLQEPSAPEHEAESDEGEDTVPFVYGNLAHKALAGRQSLAPPQVTISFSCKAHAPAETEMLCYNLQAIHVITTIDIDIKRRGVHL